MRMSPIAAIALVILFGAGCSKKDGDSSSASATAQKSSAPEAKASAAEVVPGPEMPVATSREPEAPATLTDVNLVATDVGGGVEDLTGNYGPGFTGRWLIDGAVDPPWKVPGTWTWNSLSWVKYPTEVVFSFFERQPALVGAVSIVLPEQTTAELPEETSAAPKDVEVWTSMESPAAGFRQVAKATLEPMPGEQKIEFPAIEARYVKLRVVSGQSSKELEVSEVRIFESVRDGYVPLFERDPAVKRWKGSPRDAAQRGLEWLQHAAADWGNYHQCMGCHVQAQALMGLAVAIDQGYRVNARAVHELAEQIRSKQDPVGRWPTTWWTANAFGSMGLAQAAGATGRTADPQLMKGADLLIVRQESDGSIPADAEEAPIIQGAFMTTANSLVAWRWADAHSKDAKYRHAADRALAWIASHEPVTTQDQAFRIIALMHYGTPEHKRIAWSTAESLAAQQQPDGGWKEAPPMKGSNAFATGQALYAFKQAGISVESEMFRRGVGYLMERQVNDGSPGDGSWKATNTQSHRMSDFAPTMWAVIGLAGSYGEAPMGALQVTKQGDKAAGRNLEIVLDVSGSMNTRLGDRSRWETALGTLREVVTSLPDDLNVGLRVYGHRYSSKSAETCQDTELLVPIARLDREKILSAAASLKPRGETPLVRSVLKTVGDLKAAGGGSVILITDGEESCQGNAKSAASEIAKSGVNLTLNIVGFTLTGKKVEAELGSFARATGGQYYGAQNGAQLSRAIRMAAAQRLPYDILDGSGKVVASGETSGLSRELPPGNYRIRIDALGQALEEPLTIVPDQTTMLRLGVEGDQFVIRR
jgi:hypothetical protein